MELSTLKQLREATGASIMACKRALEKAKGDIKKAKEYLKEDAQAVVQKTSDRATSQGVVASYVHSTKRVAALVEIHCETDFVARTDKFQSLASELALHIAGMNPKDVTELMKQPYVRDTSLTVNDLVAQAIGNLGENISVVRFIRYEI